jgi:hypothetical protein
LSSAVGWSFALARGKFVNRFLHLNCWVAIPLTVAGVIGLVALTYPGGLSAAYQDVRDSGELNEQLSEAQREDESLEFRKEIVVERIANKEAAITHLIDGHIRFPEAVERFLELIQEDEANLSVLRNQYGKRSVEELASRNVIAYVAKRNPPHVTALLEQFRREHESRFPASR